MSESNPIGENQNQSLQKPEDSPAPNPFAGPTSVSDAPIIDKLTAVGLTVIGGGAALFFAGAMLTPCAGATRSARLSQGQRRQEIAEAILQIDAEELRQTGSARDADPAR